MSVRVVVGVPSPSKGALRRPPLRRASSTIVTRSFATLLPTLFAKRLRPFSTLSAEKRGAIAPRRLCAIHGSSTTGSFCVANGFAPSLSVARFAARAPIRGRPPLETGVVDREVSDVERAARDAQISVRLGDARHATRLLDARLDARCREVGGMREAHPFAIEHAHAKSAFAASDDDL